MRIAPPVTVLLVEDNDFDVRRIERAVERLELDIALVRASDGIEGLELLRRGAIPYPFIVLLDLNMPRMNGLEFLRELRSDPALRQLTVFVVTTSDYYNDVQRAHDFGISGYYIKPKTSHEMSKITRSLMHLVSVAKYPAAPALN